MIAVVLVVSLVILSQLRWLENYQHGPVRWCWRRLRLDLMRSFGMMAFVLRGYLVQGNCLGCKHWPARYFSLIWPRYPFLYLIGRKDKAALLANITANWASLDHRNRLF